MERKCKNARATLEGEEEEEGRQGEEGGEEREDDDELNSTRIFHHQQQQQQAKMNGNGTHSQKSSLIFIPFAGLYIL